MALIDNFIEGFNALKSSVHVGTHEGYMIYSFYSFIFSLTLLHLILIEWFIGMLYDIN